MPRDGTLAESAARSRGHRGRHGDADGSREVRARVGAERVGAGFVALGLDDDLGDHATSFCWLDYCY